MFFLINHCHFNITARKVKKRFSMTENFRRIFAENWNSRSGHSKLRIIFFHKSRNPEMLAPKKMIWSTILKLFSFSNFFAICTKIQSLTVSNPKPIINNFAKPQSWSNSKSRLSHNQGTVFNNYQFSMLFFKPVDFQMASNDIIFLSLNNLFPSLSLTQLRFFFRNIPQTNNCCSSNRKTIKGFCDLFNPFHFLLVPNIPWTADL